MSNRACLNERCRDPCIGSCGIATKCTVINHTPICTCLDHYIGDPFTSCHPRPPPQSPTVVKDDPCQPSPCGTNAECHGTGICTCIPSYHGDPYVGCRPECVVNSDCPRTKACLQQHCTDPCIGTCAQSAICHVNNHVPMCTCPDRMHGNAFVQCRPNVVMADVVDVPLDPCYPTPCGPNSQCRVTFNSQATCSCLPGFSGTAPMCRPECVLNSDCLPALACLNQKCIDPCVGACGRSAMCRPSNHNAICSCQPGYTGDPFLQCSPIGNA